MTVSPFNNSNPETLVTPAKSIALVIPNDTVNLPNGVCRALLVGSGGLAYIVDASGNLCANVPLQTGYNPIGVTRVWATHLTANNIWALY